MMPEFESGETRAKRPLFRAAALQHYEQRREKAVLPRFIAPRLFVFLWMVSGLLIAGGAAAWLTPIPVYASGNAVVVASPFNDQTEREPVVVAVFLPAEDRAYLQVGQAVLLQIGSGGERLSMAILAIEPDIISPEVAQQRFGLTGATAQIIQQPSVVVITRLAVIRADWPVTSYLGSIYRADVQIGSRRVISLLPLIGPLFRE